MPHGRKHKHEFLLVVARIGGFRHHLGHENDIAGLVCVAQA